MLIKPIPVTKPQLDTTAIGPKSKDPGPTKGSNLSPERKGEKKEDAEFLQDVLEVAQKHFHIRNIGLDFTVHGGTGRVKVTVFDKETGDMIREVPPEQVLNLVAKIGEMMGILFDQKA